MKLDRHLMWAGKWLECRIWEETGLGFDLLAHFIVAMNRVSPAA
jgi:hypothetical protein